jgi:hypothetical protein
MGDGGYSKAWRHQVNHPHQHVRAQVTDDVEQMEYSLGLNAVQMDIVHSTELAVRRYLHTVTLRQPHGDTLLKQQALDAIDAMEQALDD